MRPIHILGLGFVVGMTALGAMMAIMTYRWALAAYPEAPAAAAQQPAAQSGAPASADVAQGKTIFGQKCSSCHTIGGGKLVGPDLKGVADRRPHEWLVSFISAPDKLISSGDPTAAQLVQQYGMPMPNVGVTTRQAEQVLAYITSASGGGASSTPGAPSGGAAASIGGPSTAPASTPTAAAVPTAPAPVLPTTAAAPAAGSAQGKTLFDQKCAACHTIGGGGSVGPDLKGVSSQRPRDWLIQFITSPDKLIASGDPTAKQLVQQYGMPMPNLGITNAQAAEILAYIDAQSGGAPGAAAAPAPTPVQTGNPAVGRALFTGQKPLVNRGPACAACHNAAGAGVMGGGTWGLDLTHAQSKFGTSGLVSIMKAPPYPGMAEAFQGHPITDTEVGDLAGFLVETDSQAEGASASYLFVLTGVGVFVLLILLSHLLWRDRAPSVWEHLMMARQRRRSEG